MRFQGPAIQLLDDIYQAARASILEQSSSTTFIDNCLNIMLEPLSPEACVWIDTNFYRLDDSVGYALFRQISPEIKLDLTFRALHYSRSSQAIACLLDPHLDNPTNSSAAAKRLHVVVQHPHELNDFLDLYIAVAGTHSAGNQVGLDAAVDAATRFWAKFDPYHHVAEIS